MRTGWPNGPVTPGRWDRRRRGRHAIQFVAAPKPRSPQRRSKDHRYPSPRHGRRLDCRSPVVMDHVLSVQPRRVDLRQDTSARGELNMAVAIVRP